MSPCLGIAFNSHGENLLALFTPLEYCHISESPLLLLLYAIKTKHICQGLFSIKIQPYRELVLHHKNGVQASVQLYH